MAVDVPMKGIRALYGRIGDWLGWLSVGLVGPFGLGAVIFGRRARID